MQIGEQKVLQALLEHPYADPFWLGEYLGARTYTTRVLQTLKQRGYARGFSFSRDDLKLKRVWTITPEGVKQLAEMRGIASKEFARAYSYRHGRMAWLVLTMERVTRLRWWMKTLEGFNSPQVGRRNALALKPLPLSSAPMWKWEVIRWQEEIQVAAKNKNTTKYVGFTGAAALSSRETKRWFTLLIHFDDVNFPVNAQRGAFTFWLKAQQNLRAFDAEGNLILSPLAVVAQTDYRLNEYVILFREMAHGIFPLPNIYFTLDKNLKDINGNPAQPIWYNLNAGENKILLGDERGFAGELFIPWRPICPRVKTGSKPLIVPQRAEPTGNGLDELAVTALTLSDTEHKLVRYVAAHPLLSAQELASLTKRCPSQIATGLGRLVKFGLVERKIIPADVALTESAYIETDKRKIQRKRETGFYVITEPGERYLAATDGFATALARYRQVKVWSPEQTQRRVREWTHTRLGNLLFIKLTRAAHARGWELEWLSEVESRFYFSLNGKRHAYLPDGRGVLRAGDQRIHFVVEIDTTRSNADKLRRKIARCYASVVARMVPENPEERITILFVTHSTERLKHVQRIARELEAEMDSTQLDLRRVAPILFGHQQLIVNPRETIDRANWVDLDRRRVCCFPQFELSPRPPDITRTGQVIYIT